MRKKNWSQASATHASDMISLEHIKYLWWAILVFECRRWSRRWIGTEIIRCTKSAGNQEVFPCSLSGQFSVVHNKLTAVGFEPTQFAPSELESDALDHSATLSVKALAHFRFYRNVDIISEVPSLRSELCQRCMFCVVKIKIDLKNLSFLRYRNYCSRF